MNNKQKPADDLNTEANTLWPSNQLSNQFSNWFSKLTTVNLFAQLGPDFASEVSPLPLENPRLVDVNPAAASELNLDLNNDDNAIRQGLMQLLNGQSTAPGLQPIAMLYAGHQFGSWVPQLGDGRAMTITQVKNQQGALWELQTKGSGPTPFSRRADGRAVLRSTIREYLCSEAMHALGIPTTRALAIIDSDTPVYREEIETGAVLLRMAENHIRFGSFEVFASRNQTEQVKILADHLIENYRPELKDCTLPYLALYKDVIQRTAELIADWQSVGFCHGVMNTDNMSILGLTIDYGPFGFMEGYNPEHICNHSDTSGRYAYNRQADIAWWNLAALGNALLSLIEVESAKEAIESYKDIYQQALHQSFSKKLGLIAPNDASQSDTNHLEQDAALIRDWLDLLAEERVDFTSAFRLLSHFSTSATEPCGLAIRFANSNKFEPWLNRYKKRLSQQNLEESVRQQQMLVTNPKYILRNYLAEAAIAKAKQGDYSEVVKLREVLSKPYDEQPENEAYSEPAPDWASDIAVSCSS